MAQLAIKGHATRGREVIELLEMLGGFNSYTYEGCERNSIFTISNYSSIINVFPSTNYAIFTLEEFREKFPYKVGNKVIYDKDIELEIVKMYWDDKFNIVRYDVQGVVDRTFKLKGLMTSHFLHYKDKTIVEEYENFAECLAKTLQECSYGKEETMKEKLEQITLDIPDGYEFFGINDDNKVVLTKKYIQYPKTFIEVLNFWHPDRQIEDDYQRCYKKDLIEKFQDLLYARDAYWKIVGEQMGLGESWKPDWKDFSTQKYSISVDKDKIITSCRVTGSRMLVFPTSEMRDAFFGNFEYLIEECKELL